MDVTSVSNEKLYVYAVRFKKIIILIVEEKQLLPSVVHCHVAAAFEIFSGADVFLQSYLFTRWRLHLD